MQGKVWLPSEIKRMRKYLPVPTRYSKIPWRIESVTQSIVRWTNPEKYFGNSISVDWEHFFQKRKYKYLTDILSSSGESRTVIGKPKMGSCPSKDIVSNCEATNLLKLSSLKTKDSACTVRYFSLVFVNTRIISGGRKTLSWLNFTDTRFEQLGYHGSDSLGISL